MYSQVLHYVAVITANGAADGVRGRNKLNDAASHLS